MTYCVPKLEIVPIKTALLPARWQNSRVTSRVSRSSFDRFIICKTSLAFWSERIFRKGDCSSCNAQSLFQRVVKGGIACGVVEISENDGVFLCEAQSFPAKIEACDACSSNKKYRSNSEQAFPADLSSIKSRNESTHARREHEPN